jgi:hypothetical protein
VGGGMTIDIEGLSETQLRDLNRRVVERLRAIQQLKTYDAMLKFRVGDEVTFNDHYGDAVYGVLVRHNRKSVTVHGDDGRHWNVSPQLLRKPIVSDHAEPAKHYDAATPIDRVDDHALGKRLPAPKRRLQISLLDDCLTQKSGVWLLQMKRDIR